MKCTNHKINIRFERFAPMNLILNLQIRACIATALKMENVKAPCEINVLITDDNGIQAINREMRELDKATDVLSFPMFDLVAGEFPFDVRDLQDPETGFVPLGDMVISLERAQEQAREYCHSLRREVGYLTVHSILHLLGYDHLDEAEQKRAMRAREEAILAEVELPRK